MLSRPRGDGPGRPRPAPPRKHDWRDGTGASMLSGRCEPRFAGEARDWPRKHDTHQSHQTVVLRGFHASLFWRGARVKYLMRAPFERLVNTWPRLGGIGNG